MAESSAIPLKIVRAEAADKAALFGILKHAVAFVTEFGERIHDDTKDKVQSNDKNDNPEREIHYCAHADSCKVARCWNGLGEALPDTEVQDRHKTLPERSTKLALVVVEFGALPTKTRHGIIVSNDNDQRGNPQQRTAIPRHCRNDAKKEVVVYDDVEQVQCVWIALERNARNRETEKHNVVYRHGLHTVGEVCGWTQKKPLHQQNNTERNVYRAKHRERRHEPRIRLGLPAARIRNDVHCRVVVGISRNEHCRCVPSGKHDAVEYDRNHHRHPIRHLRVVNDDVGHRLLHQRVHVTHFVHDLFASLDKVLHFAGWGRAVDVPEDVLLGLLSQSFSLLGCALKVYALNVAISQYLNRAHSRLILGYRVRAVRLVLLGLLDRRLVGIGQLKHRRYILLRIRSSRQISNASRNNVKRKPKFTARHRLAIRALEQLLLSS
eukprot:Opistho-2@68684